MRGTLSPATSPSVTVTLEELSRAFDQIGVPSSVSPAALYHAILQVQKKPSPLQPPSTLARRKALLQMAKERPKDQVFPSAPSESIMVDPGPEFYSPARRERRQKLLKLAEASFPDGVPSPHAVLPSCSRGTHLATISVTNDYDRSQQFQPNVALFLVERGASIDKDDKYGWSLLHHASEAGHLDIPQTLIQQSASDIDKEYRQTLLHFESQVLDVSVDINGWSPLHHALLIEHGASVDKEGKYGLTPLHLASQKGYVGIAQVLIEHGAPVDKEDKYGWTPLYQALLFGHPNIAQVLIEHGASVNKENKDGQNPLHFVSQEGYLEIAQLLIEHGASIDKEDKNGWTPLHLALEGGHLNIAQVLIEHDASVDKETYVPTSFHLASRTDMLAR